MKLSQRSYPHPVVGNADDVLGSAFQCTVEMTTDKENIYLSAQARCSSATISRLLISEKAKIVLHVECSNTLYRKAFEFTGTDHKVTIPRNELNHDVEVNSFIRAAADIKNYQVEGVHSDYGSAKFEIKTGDILAVGEGHLFVIETTFDAMGRIGSIFQILQASEDGDQPMKMNVTQDKFIIILSRPDLKAYKQLKTIPHLAGLLTTMVVMPALIEAIEILRTSDADDSRRWVKNLSRRFEELGLNKEDDTLLLAQKLLELPYKRAFAEATVSLED